MKRLLQFVLLFTVAVSNAQGQTKGSAPVPLEFTEYFTGKPTSVLPQSEDQVKEFKFDSETTIFFAAIVGEKLYNILSHNDTIFMILEVNDLKFSGGESFLYAMYGDSTWLLKFNEAFRERYSQGPDFDTLPLSFIDIGLDCFGVAVGEDGTPTDSGKRYLELAKQTVTEDQLRILLLGFNPIDRLIGLALFNEQVHATCRGLYNTFISGEYLYRYRYGCGPLEMLQAREVVKELRAVGH